jgi:hypothetical protein
MAMEPPAFWLVVAAMLVGKSGRGNNPLDYQRYTAGQHEPAGKRCRLAGDARLTEIRAGKVPKIFVTPRPVTISQAMKVTKWSTFIGDFDRERTTGRADQR